MGQLIELESVAAERSPAVEAAPIAAAVRTDAVHVVFTSIDATASAVRIGAELAKGLAVPLTLIHLRTVPYVLPVDARNGVSPLETDAFVHRLGESARDAGVDVRVRVYLCRDVRRAIPMAVKPHSLIVIAGRRSWWPTPAERWRRALEDAGHFVVFVDETGHKERTRA